MKGTLPVSLESAKQRAGGVANSGRPYESSVELVRNVYPWRFEKLSTEVIERDYLRIVDHHLEHLAPRVGRHTSFGIYKNRQLPFWRGCGAEVAFKKWTKPLGKLRHSLFVEQGWRLAGRDLVRNGEIEVAASMTSLELK